MLTEYRATFLPAYEQVISLLRTALRLEPTGRPAKSTSAIVDKLKRESIRLSQLQDIAGCRIVVPTTIRQEQVLSRMTKRFPDARIVDRRIEPSHGYRAVHVLVLIDRKIVEVQIRTAFQHAWAELSEKIADRTDPAVKYGGGPPVIRGQLLGLSQSIANLETIERETSERRRHMARAVKELDKYQRELKAMQAQHRAFAKRLPRARSALLQREQELAAMRSRLRRARAKVVAAIAKDARTAARIGRFRRSETAAIRSIVASVSPR
jgi:ppGpp synthetase/RelA/SpoT-type nucleotidyltranferase